MDAELVFAVGFVLLVAGFIIAFAVALLLVLKAVREKGRVRGGGVVMIGPFPIVFGTDKESVKVLLLLSIVLIVLVLVFSLFSYYVFLSGGSAGVVWVLPFPPIIWGVGWPYPVWAVSLTVALTVVGVVLFVLFRRRARRI
ncbi:MAG: DUF131 domain-containing protein [Candidatus Bathyarchaeia archaeon]